MSFFGGDHTKAHFTATLPSILSGQFKTTEARRAAIADRDAKRATLKNAGFKDRYFQFTEGNEKEKARARILAEAEAKLWLDATGVKLEVLEGCFL